MEIYVIKHQFTVVLGVFNMRNTTRRSNYVRTRSNIENRLKQFQYGNLIDYPHQNRIYLINRTEYLTMGNLTILKMKKFVSSFTYYFFINFESFASSEPMVPGLRHKNRNRKTVEICSTLILRLLWKFFSSEWSGFD